MAVASRGTCAIGTRRLRHGRFGLSGPGSMGTICGPRSVNDPSGFGAPNCTFSCCPKVATPSSLKVNTGPAALNTISGDASRAGRLYQPVVSDASPESYP